MLEQITLQGTGNDIKRNAHEGDISLTLWTVSNEEAKKLVQQLEARKEDYGAYDMLVYDTFVEIAPPLQAQTERFYEDYKKGVFPQIKEITTAENKVYLD